ncbi:unnamed protein product [Paramecium sonneborni]|uniref:Uncharacterized protein n=1 Tax=Paramecium sonneborni TaxID=65129 RepID=A0A8S1L717_9CILI|nr:unnamed protein product [Paramecium sonneborni]
MDQQEGQEQILNNPQNLEQYNNNEQSQKNEFLEQILKAKVNEDLIQWLMGQLNQAKALCLELTKENTKNQETHLKNLMQIIDNSLERTKNSKISLENDISNNSVSQESYCNQGTSIFCQDNFLTNINYVSDMNKQIVIFNQAILHSSQDDDQFEFQRGSEQFRHSEQYSDYYQMHNHQQQQKQMQSIMDQEVDIQSPINHRINQEQKQSILKKIKAIVAQINQYQLEQNQYKETIDKYMQDWSNDILNLKKREQEIEIDKYEKSIQYYNEQQKKLEEKLEQYQYIESVANENINIIQLSQKHSKGIQNFISKEKLEENLKNKINQFVEKNFKALNFSVQKILQEESKNYKNKNELLQNEIESLKQGLQKVINDKQEILNELSLQSFNDQNVCFKMQQMQELLKEISNKTNQTTQKLNDNNLDQIVQQIKQIRHTITGDSERNINELNHKLAEKEEQIKQLKQDNQNLENQLKNNESSQFLSQIIVQFQQKQESQLNQQDQINLKTNKILEIESTLNNILKYINIEKESLKQQYQEEKNKAIQTQLEGCFKLQDKSLLYIQLGLKIFQQYYLSENSDDDAIKKLIAELIKFHKKYQEKKNFSLKDLKDIEKFYTNLEMELKNLYDNSLDLYKRFIRDIQQRRNQ